MTNKCEMEACEYQGDNVKQYHFARDVESQQVLCVGHSRAYHGLQHGKPMGGFVATLTAVGLTSLLVALMLVFKLPFALVIVVGIMLPVAIYRTVTYDEKAYLTNLNRASNSTLEEMFKMPARKHREPQKHLFGRDDADEQLAWKAWARSMNRRVREHIETRADGVPLFATYTALDQAGEPVGFYSTLTKRGWLIEG